MSTISTVVNHTILIDGTTYTSPLYVTNTGAVYNNGTAAAIVGSGDDTVVNQGTISATGSENDGIDLTAGGNVANTSASAVIASADRYGVYITNAAGTVTNAGTISGANDAVKFGNYNDLLIVDPGAVFNGALDGGGGTNTIELASAASTGTLGATFTNFQTITVDSGANWVLAGYDNFSDLTLTGTGTLTNAGNGTLRGTYLTDTLPTLVNNGLILTNKGLTLNAGAYLDNTNGIVGNSIGVAGIGGAVTIVNSGSIKGSLFGGYGVYLTQGGTVTNSGSASYISGIKYGIQAFGAPSTISNAGTIKATGTPTFGIPAYAVTMSAGSLQNSGLITSTGYGVRLAGGGTISNTGTITGSGGVGVYFGAAGGVISNSGTTALISGSAIGVKFISAAGTVTNAGTISGGSQAIQFASGNDRLIVDPGAVFVRKVDGGGGNNTIELASGATTGTLSNLGSQYANFQAFVVDAGASWTVTGAAVSSMIVNGSLTFAINDPSYRVTVNAGGYVKNTGTMGAGITLGFGGTLNNLGDVAGSLGVYAKFAPAVVTNASQGVIGNGSSYAVRLVHGGSVINKGVIGAVLAPVHILNGYGYVYNSGQILDGGASRNVVLYSGGNVFNKGLISGGYYDVWMEFGGGTVTNLGTINGSDHAGIALQRGGAVVNGSSTVITAAITNIGPFGVKITTFGGAVTNYATIANASNYGVYLTASGAVSNIGTAALISAGVNAVRISGGLGTVTNEGSIRAASYAIYLRAGGSVANTGIGALISGASGVRISNGLGTVANDGTIKGSSGNYGVLMQAGGSVANTGTGALISGKTGVAINVAAGDVTNAGTISGSSAFGVFLIAGGSVANTGTAALISGGNDGVYITGAAGIVTNDGTIAGTGTAGIGAYLQNSGGNTLTNSGTIAGSGTGDAVKFGAGNDRLIVDPGAVFVGTIDGGGGSNTLELASAATTGTLSGLGSQFENFGTVIIDPGANWVLGSGDTIASGTTLTNTGTLTLASAFTDQGVFSNSGTILGSGTLLVDPTTFTNSGYSGVEVDLAAGSALVNTNTGTIKVAGTAVYGETGGAAYVTNSGTIIGTGTSLSGAGVYLKGGGTIANGATNATGALIEGNRYGVKATGAAAAITNAGTITGYTGIALGDFANTVIDSGTIAGTGGVAISFGTANDLLQFTPSASIKIQGTVDGGGGTNTLEFASAATTGTLTGVGADFVNFSKGTIDSGASWVLAGTNTFASSTTLTNSGALTDTGTLTNAGSIGATGSRAGVNVAQNGILTNASSGYITSSGVDQAAVQLIGSSATVRNQGTLSGFYGIFGASNNANIVNSGTGSLIRGALAGVEITGLATGGTVTNYGTIQAGFVGVQLKAQGTIINKGTASLIKATTGSGRADGISSSYYPSTIINYGTISGAYGVYMLADGNIANKSTGTIMSVAASQPAIKTFGTYSVTIDNAGSILATAATGTAVSFYSTSSGLLIDRPGAAFRGDGGRRRRRHARTSLRGHRRHDQRDRQHQLYRLWQDRSR